MRAQFYQAPVAGTTRVGARGCPKNVIPGRRIAANPESTTSVRAPEPRLWLWIPGSSLRDAPE
jgi:hypothetical protein